MSNDFPLHWHSPPSPCVVNTVPVGTPPPSPLADHATHVVDVDAPCPATPYLVLSPGASPEYSEPDDHPYFVDPLTELASSSADDPPDGSGSLVQAHELFGYPNPMLTLIERAILDLTGRQSQLLNPWACTRPSSLLTASHIPLTGSRTCDEQSFDYYNIPLAPSWLNSPDVPHFYSIGTIQALQQELRMSWRSVFPEPIPPIIIRSHDIVGPYCLNRRTDGWAFVVPAQDSIWDWVRQRGVDPDCRPLMRSVTVDTAVQDPSSYSLQHIAASKFAVNVFLELPNATGVPHVCEYLGAYVLQVGDPVTRTLSVRSAWENVPLQGRVSILERVPRSRWRTRGRPPLERLRFCYYHWDLCIIRAATIFTHGNISGMYYDDDYATNGDWMFANPYSILDDDDRDAIPTQRTSFAHVSRLSVVPR